jgi:transposase
VAAVPYRVPPGAPPTVTAAWRAELLRVVDLDPRRVGVASTIWTTRLLADDLAGATGLRVSLETVRRSLHAAGYVCKRPTWTLKRKAQEQAEYPGNAPGWRRC